MTDQQRASCASTGRLVGVGRVFASSDVRTNGWELAARLMYSKDRFAITRLETPIEHSQVVAQHLTDCWQLAIDRRHTVRKHRAESCHRVEVCTAVVFVTTHNLQFRKQRAEPPHDVRCMVRQHVVDDVDHACRCLHGHDSSFSIDVSRKNRGTPAA